MPVEFAPAPAAPAGTPSGATPAPAPADNAPKAPAAGVTLPTTGSGAPAPAANDWLAGLDDTSRELATNKKWTSAADALKSYSELEKAFSSRPAAGTPPTYKADDYKFTLPPNAPDIGYSDAFATGFKGKVAEFGIAPEAAAKLHDWYVGFATESQGRAAAAHTEQLSSRISDTEAALTKSWGATNSPVFGRNLELARRAISQLGVMDAAMEAGVLAKGADGRTVVTDAAMFEMFSKVGQAMFAEDTVFGSPDVGVNPFDPKTANATAQGNLIKSDPGKALLLIGALQEADQAMWKAVLPSIKARAAGAQR